MFFVLTSIFWFVVSKLRKLLFLVNGFFAVLETNSNKLSNTGISKRAVMFFNSSVLPLILVGAAKVRKTISVTSEPTENIRRGHFNAMDNDIVSRLAAPRCVCFPIHKWRTTKRQLNETNTNYGTKPCFSAVFRGCQ